MGECVKETLFIHGILNFFKLHIGARPVKVYEGNQEGIGLADNPMSSAHSKHIDIHLYFVRHLVADGEIKIAHVISSEQHADILTKSLGYEDSLTMEQF